MLISISRQGLKEKFVGVTIAPILGRFVRPDDGVFGRFIVFGRVPVDRVVTAANMAARFAQPQVEPSIAGFKALFAPGGTWDHVLNC
jgi:hypothetical protein